MFNPAFHPLNTLASVVPVHDLKISSSFSILTNICTILVLVPVFRTTI